MKEFLKKALKYVDLRGLLIDLILKDTVKKAIKKVVKDSKNPYDDSLEAILMPIVEKEATIAVDKMLKKLLK